MSRSGSDGHSERANVAIGTPWFGLRVVAAEYESGDAPERVLDFYRDQLRPLGPVTECRGDLDFKDGRPRCRADADAKDVQLVVGSEQRHRMVSVQPRGSGTSFALVSIQMGS